MSPPRKNHPPRARMNTSLPGALRHRLSEYSTARGVAECEVLRLAVEQYLNGTSDMTLLYRRIDASHRKVDRLHRTLELHGELLKEFLLIYLEAAAQEPTLAASSPAPRRKASQLYEGIVQRVITALASHKTWIDDLPQESLSPEEPPPETPRRAVGRDDDEQSGRGVQTP
jgi:hypothetical protein